MQQLSPLQRLALAMLAGASFGCEQTREGCYWSETDHTIDGAPVYAFCAIGCAVLGLIGYVPKNLMQQLRLFEMAHLREALGVDWDLLVYLPDGSRDTLATAICHLNDHKRWPVVRIAAWLLMLDAGWKVQGGSLYWRGNDGQTLVLNVHRYHKVVAAIKPAYRRDPRHPTWERIADPTWWASRIPAAEAPPDAGNDIP